MGKIIVLMGPSSSGKDTILKKIIKESPYDLKNIIMHTTRPMRTGETNGREYYFCTELEMKQLEEERKIIELRSYNTVKGIWHYFTASSNIDLNKYNYIVANTLVGLDQYIKYYGKEKIIPILIKLEDGLRLSRALSREMKEQNPNYQEMCRRFLADCEDFSLENIKKRNINNIVENNESLDITMKRVDKILKYEL